MCDKAHYDRLADKVDEHDDRLDELEKTDAVHDAKFTALADSVKIMRNVVYVFCFIFMLLMLLAIIYGALGQRGFNAVTSEAQKMTHNQIHFSQAKE